MTVTYSLYIGSDMFLLRGYAHSLISFLIGNLWKRIPGQIATRLKACIVWTTCVKWLRINVAMVVPVSYGNFDHPDGG